MCCQRVETVRVEEQDANRGRKRESESIPRRDLSFSGSGSPAFPR
jgi:hypothetical protein